MLVLAVAGLIFMMVFVALPNLQRTQRNTQRKNFVNEVLPAVERFRVNNHGKLPMFAGDGDADRFIRHYIDTDAESYTTQVLSNGRLASTDDCSDISTAPDGNCYGFFAGSLGSEFEDPDNVSLGEVFPGITDDYLQDVIIIFGNSSCGGQEGMFSYSPRKNDYSVMAMLEGGSFTCVDSK